jgi:hypothetical protein
VGVRDLTPSPHHDYNVYNNDREWVSKLSKVIVRTEKWSTKGGSVIKAVARTDKGIFLGATNQTQAVPFEIVGK